MPLTRAEARKIALAVVVLGAIGWYAFRPERLFLNQDVNEGLPVAEDALPAEMTPAIESVGPGGPAAMEDGRCGSTFLDLPRSLSVRTSQKVENAVRPLHRLHRRLTFTPANCVTSPLDLPNDLLHLRHLGLELL